MKHWKLWLFCLMLFLAFGTTITANDLSDGISTYKEEPISKDDSLGGPDTNVEFIAMNAKSRSSVSMKNGQVLDGEDSTGNINSVVLRPGSNVYGDIIIIDQSQAAKSIVIGQGIASNVASNLLPVVP